MIRGLARMLALSRRRRRCVRRQSTSPGLTPNPPLQRAGLTIRFLDTGTSLLSTRCAGPLDRDVIAAAPQATISLGRALRSQTTLDLSGTRSFAAGGFAGTVSSTIRLRLVRSSTRRLSGGGFPSNVRTRRIRIVAQPLTIVGVAGRLTASVRGTDDAVVCRQLDSCGLPGALSLTPRP